VPSQWNGAEVTVPFRGSPHKAAGKGSGVATASVNSIVGVSAWVTEIREEILRVAASSSSVLITGPTGTGKELIARAIHGHSPRAQGPFIAVDCAAVNGALFAGQMFGHVKGAFTGASQASLGYFRAADGGTVFLDEIGELEPTFQAMLLRALQQKCVTPLGSYEEMPVDVRVIAATNCDLEEMVRERRFRDDLYYRINVVSLTSVALKERREDIEILATHFLTRQAAESGTPRRHLSPRCLECLRTREWPGNVRELENFLERAALVKGDMEIGLAALLHHCDDVPKRPGFLWTEPPSPEPVAEVGRPPPQAAAPGADAGGPWPDLAQAERQHLLRTLERTGYNQTAAARLLNIPRKQLARKIKKHRIDVSRSHPGRPAN
jgi:DNA-binding NtrC family response regulator